MGVHFGGLDLDWFGYATLRVASSDRVVYMDPGRYGVLTGSWRADSESAELAHPRARDRRPRDGDLVCISHVHHYDPDGIERVAGPDATLLVFDGIDVHGTTRTDVRPLDLPYDVRRIGHEEDFVAANLPVSTVPAYNLPDGPHTREDGSPVHPEGFGCGFLVSIGDTRVFWPGDTDVLEGHEALDVDVFCPPIGGSFTMDRHEAAELAAEMEPGLVFPIHYNTFEALETDSGAFAADVAKRGIPVALAES